MTGRGKGKSDPLSGRRGATVRVKTAKRRSISSTRWLARQLNDPYVAAAKAEGYRSRAAFKLMELDDRFGFLKPGARVLDLGAAPGGWSQIAAKRIGAEQGGPAAKRGKLVALDILPMAPLPGVTILEADMNAEDAPARIRAALDGPADVVLSDMAAPTTGDRETDHMRVVQLCDAAFAFAEEVLTPGGTFIAKVFQGGAEKTLLDLLKRRFQSVRHVKPKASRAESPELYVVAMGYRGAAGP